MWKRHLKCLSSFAVHGVPARVIYNQETRIHLESTQKRKHTHLPGWLVKALIIKNVFNTLLDWALAFRPTSESLWRNDQVKVTKLQVKALQDKIIKSNAIGQFYPGIAPNAQIDSHHYSTRSLSRPELSRNTGTKKISLTSFIILMNLPDVYQFISILMINTTHHVKHWLF